MFEDSLMESTGRIRTRSRYFAIGSFAVQAALLAALALYPFLHPSTLSNKTLTMLLTAPPVPPSPANLPQHVQTNAPRQPVMIDNPLAAPRLIPQHVNMNSADTPPSAIDTGLGRSSEGIDTGLFRSLSSPTPPDVKPATPRGPMHISSGVAKGQLLTPIQPVYPAIARAARIQGTVVIQAVISKEGMIEKLQVISGPPMLQSAAVEAVQRARYRPFTLNGEPVAVETTINIVFTLGG